jgi:translocation protein SEC72
MATQISSFEVSLSSTEKIVCLQHGQEVCENCRVDWTEQNELALSIKPLKEIPSPNKPIQSVNAQVNRLKIEGNKAYKENNYQEAIEFYNSGVQLAWSRPLWEPLAFQYVREELAPILSNRSAAHVALEHYIEALVDAEMVTRIKKDWSKGWFRKGKALAGLERYIEAIGAYKIGLRYGVNNEELLVALKQAENAL